MAPERHDGDGRDELRPGRLPAPDGGRPPSPDVGSRAARPGGGAPADPPSEPRTGSPTDPPVDPSVDPSVDAPVDPPAGTAADEEGGEPDPLDFPGSPRRTIGVELELPVLDRDTHGLAPGAPRILDACRDADVPGTSAELMQSMLEVKTGICETVDDVEAQLVDRLRRVRNVARSLGFELGLLGTHPFEPVTMNALTPDERYGKVAQRLGWLAWHRVTFGLHFHVGVPGGDAAMWTTNLLTQYLPHLLGASANSPFWQGVDTGFASFRMALYGLVPHAGIPRRFTSWREFRGYVQVMRDCEVVQSFKDVKWDVRPRPDFGTIEIRVCDTPPSLGRVLGLAALVRSLVIDIERLLERRPDARLADLRRDWIDVENKWLAARRGLDSVYVRTASGKRRNLRQELADLVERMRPIAAESGDARHLARLTPVERMESGPDRQRRVFRDTGAWREVTRDAVARLDADLERLGAVPAAASRASTSDGEGESGS